MTERQAFIDLLSAAIDALEQGKSPQDIADILKTAQIKLEVQELVDEQAKDTTVQQGDDWPPSGDKGLAR